MKLRPSHRSRFPHQAAPNRPSTEKSQVGFESLNLRQAKGTVYCLTAGDFSCVSRSTDGKEMATTGNVMQTAVDEENVGLCTFAPVTSRYFPQLAPTPTMRTRRECMEALARQAGFHADPPSGNCRRPVSSRKWDVTATPFPSPVDWTAFPACSSGTVRPAGGCRSL